MKKTLFILAMLVSFQGFALDYGQEEVDKKYERPKRELSVIVTKDGYFPEKLVAFKGEEVTFFVTGSGDEMGCMIVENHKLFLSAKQGKISSGKLILDKAGTFNVYCPSGNYRGHLMVLEKKKKKKISREIASGPQEWMPKEY